MSTTIKLGDQVRDTVSGFKGVVVCRAEWMNGCVRFSVQAKVDKDGKIPELQWIDEPQCVLVTKAKKPNDYTPRGGPRKDPARSF